MQQRSYPWSSRASYHRTDVRALAVCCAVSHLAAGWTHRPSRPLHSPNVQASALCFHKSLSPVWAGRAGRRQRVVPPSKHRRRPDGAVRPSASGVAKPSVSPSVFAGSRCHPTPVSLPDTQGASAQMVPSIDDEADEPRVEGGGLRGRDCRGDRANDSSSSSSSSSSNSSNGETKEGSGPWKLWCVLVTSATAMPPGEQLSMVMSTAKSIKQRTGGTSIRFAVVCDGHKGPEEGRTVDKRGRVGPREAEQYTCYKALLKKETLFEELLEMDRHVGFGHCVAEGARQFVTTEYMLVAQHDYMFVTDVDMGMVRGALEKGSARYVVFAFGQMVNRALKLARREHGAARPREPCLLVFDKYHDKNHVIGRDVYLNEVMPHVRKGQFPEDVFSQSQMKFDPHWYRTFGICLYCDPTIEFGVLAHLKGRQTRDTGEISRRIGRLRMTAPADGEKPDLAVAT